MTVRHAKSYIDRLYEEKDLFTLHQVVGIVSAQRDLPEQFFAFVGLVLLDPLRNLAVLCKCLGTGIRVYGGSARAIWPFGVGGALPIWHGDLGEPECCCGLDSWIDAHWSEIEASSFGLIADHRDYLYGETLPDRRSPGL